MELAKELALYLESTPELLGEKLVLVRSLCQKPVTAQVAEEKFFDWAIEGMEQMANEFDLDPEEVEVSVCREVARTYATEELKRIEAGAYKELDIMMREALESALRPGTKVQVRQDGKENSGKFGTIMEDSLEELLPSAFPMTNENEVKVRMEHNNKIDKVPVNRLDVVEAATIFEPGADILIADWSENPGYSDPLTPDANAVLDWAMNEKDLREKIITADARSFEQLAKGLIYRFNKRGDEPFQGDPGEVSLLIDQYQEDAI